MHNNQVYLFSTPVAVYTWVSLCKSLPATPTSDYIKEYDEMHQQSSWLGLGFLKSFEDIKPCDPACASPLKALAVGAIGNDQAEMIYNNMMEFAGYRGLLYSQWPHEFSCCATSSI